MRIIKFRAWDDNRIVTQTGIDNEGIAGFFAYIRDDAKVMQFTGLLDKNGKEIYESDIIKIEHPHKSRTFDGPVEWLDYGWGCKDFYFSHFDSPVDIFSEGTEYIEVIGNIYQNKDLLG